MGNGIITIIGYRRIGQNDEIIVHSTGSFCIPVKTVDGKPVGGKAPEMLKTIQDALVKDFEEQCKA